jgi:hypothetical protein
MTEATPNYEGGKLTTVSTVTNVGAEGVTFSALESAMESMGTGHATQSWRSLPGLADTPVNTVAQPVVGMVAAEESMILDAKAEFEDTEAAKTTDHVPIAGSNAHAQELIAAATFAALFSVTAMVTAVRRMGSISDSESVVQMASPDIVAIEIQPIRPQAIGGDQPIVHNVEKARRMYEDGLI